MVIASLPRVAAISLVALVIAACGGSTTATTTSKWKIALMSATGTLQDHNFSQYSWEGAKKGAADIGAKDPATVVPKDSTDYARNIQNFVDAGYNLIITVGFDEGEATTKAAKANPTIQFIGVDQSPICVDAQGNWLLFGCKGDAAKLLPNYMSLWFEEDQPGYLAGMVAASISKTGVVGGVGGITIVPPVVRYLQGYELGAKSINPSVKVDVVYVTTSDFPKAFNDPVGGKVLGSQMVSQAHADVLFQVAGKTGNGVLDAACAANVYAIGVDVDQFLSYPNADPCIVTSAEKHLSNAVEQALKAVDKGTGKPGDNLFNAANNGIGLSPFHGKDNLISADLKAKLAAALKGMKDGSVKTCPATCGQV